LRTDLHRHLQTHLDRKDKFKPEAKNNPSLIDTAFTFQAFPLLPNSRSTISDLLSTESIAELLFESVSLDELADFGFASRHRLEYRKIVARSRSSPANNSGSG